MVAFVRSMIDGLYSNLKEVQGAQVRSRARGRLARALPPRTSFRQQANLQPLRTKQGRGGVLPYSPLALAEIDPEPVAAALIFPCHLGTGVAKLLLDKALIDFRGGGKTGAQRMPGKQLLAFAFR